MSSTQSFLAIDLGAESGRGVLGEFDGERLRLQEVGRFATGRGEQDLCADGVQRWDFERLLGEIDGVIAKAQSEAPGGLRGIGVDSWGVDFGLLDRDGKLLAAPVCYRDRSHAVAMESVLTRVSAEEIWDATGIQGLPFNTLYQLEAIARRDPGLLEKADRLLMVPDLIHNRLTGGAHRSQELTNASTTQLRSPGGSGWNRDLLNRLSLPSHFLPSVVNPGSLAGATADGVRVYAPATHDTASAVVAVPAAAELNGKRWAFLSSGTWSLLGAELSAAVTSREAMRAGFSNEGGVGGTTRFLKNIMGLWLVQQTRRSLRDVADRDYSYPELAALAAEAPPGALIDAVDQRFLNPIDMVAEIRSAVRESGQIEPNSVGGIVRCCLESLALAYRRSLQEMRTLAGNDFGIVHIVGGGSENALLNQWTADACGIPVLAGPSEATALGNLLGQLIGAGAVADWQEARDVSRRSFQPRLYQPDPAATEQWAERDAASREGKVFRR